MVKLACVLCRRRFHGEAAWRDHLRSDAHKAKALAAWKEIAPKKPDEARKSTAGGEWAPYVFGRVIGRDPEPVKFKETHHV